MSKTKAASRLLSSLLAILMVFCLFPKEVVSAEDEAFEISVTTSYRMNLNNDKGPVEAYIENQLLEKNPPITPIPETAKPGDTLVISLPTVTEYLDKENEVRCYFTDTANNRDFENIFVNMDCYNENGEWMYRLPFTTSDHFVLNVDDPSNTVEFTLPTEKELREAGCVLATVTVYYEWGGHVYGMGSPDESGYVTNWVDSVTRTVRQDDVKLEPETINGNEVYNIKDKENITVEYSATMDMKNLSIVTEGNSSSWGNIWWTALSVKPDVIYDNTNVDVHFRFDENLDLQKAHEDGLLKGITLNSNMFVLSDVPYTINGNELIVHCHWKGEMARAAESLNPIIEISGIVLPVKESWTGNPATFYSEGYIEGTLYLSPRKDPNYQNVNSWGNGGYHDDYMPFDEWLEEYYESGYKESKSFYDWIPVMSLAVTEIKGGGGEDSDTFLLRLPDEPEAPEEPEKAEEEKPVISSAPYLKINQHWEDESDANRPDSVLVDVYHEEEYYTTVEVFAKYGWMGGTTIPERWKDDDWWVVEKDVPLGYDSDVEETRQLVFNITNTSENH